MKIVAIILTMNEGVHLRRCLDSLLPVVTDFLVVDSGSTDCTQEIARSFGAKVLVNPWLNYATQFNWALAQVVNDADWIMRIDADEYLTLDLAGEIRAKVPQLSEDVVGIYFNRRMTFGGRMIHYGGVFPIRVLRLWRYGKGHCENRWMDEHIKVVGPTVEFQGELIDDNLNSLTWWTDKHNRYSSREAVDLLNLEYGFMLQDSVANLRDRSQASLKRWIKESVYVRLPGGLRAFAYFFYRYVIHLGFLDGQVGGDFHVLQGFWYRYLVDAKVAEVKRYMKENNVDVATAIANVLHIRL